MIHPAFGHAGFQALLPCRDDCARDWRSVGFPIAIWSAPLHSNPHFGQLQAETAKRAIA